MNPQLEEICSLVSPPDNPIGLDQPWNLVEKELKTSLPSDFKDFIDLYGSGLICGLVTIWNFRDSSSFAPPLLERLCGDGSVIRGYERVKTQGDYDWPFKLYPEAGGLLPFATIIDVYNLNWHTAGPPNEWDTVFWFSDGNEFIHMQGDSFSTFLLKMLKKEYQGNEIPQFDEPYQFTDFTDW